MSMTRHVILNHVDSPLKILLWTVPELLMLVMPIILGLMADQLTLGIAVIFLYFWVSKKYRQHFGQGQFHAVKYWYFPKDKRFKTLAPSYIREYFG
jgi:type IV conjugative transfer system protein TraL